MSYIWLQAALEKLIDFFVALVPRGRPEREKLRNAKLIAHRGHGFDFPENSLEAFREAQKAGVWGIELDVRFTLDHVPVLSHDSSLKRCFGIDQDIEKLTFHELYALKPELPTLAQVVSEFGKKIHLMIEIKSRKDEFSSFAIEALHEATQDLVPIRDYHVISLKPSDFTQFHWLPLKACLSISTFNAYSISKETLTMPIGGITGHYLLLTNRLTRKHEAIGQKIGTGFISSQNILYREVGRGVEFLFSDRAREMQEYLNDSG